MKSPPRELVSRLERTPSLQRGNDERFNGYGVMGLPFASGHVLALRRFSAVSLGPAYTSVWHRDPGGSWVFYSNGRADQSCTRYFGEDASRAVETAVGIDWDRPFHCTISVPAAALHWDVELAATLPTRVMNAASQLRPESAWRNSLVLAGMERVAGPFLGVGRVGLQGLVPNGQRFIASPRVLWAVASSRATIAGTDLGALGPVKPQAHLGDFWIPQRGIFAAGQASFEVFDGSRHSSRTCGKAR